MSKIVPVRFKGANYMCVEDSPRAKFLSQANSLWLTGDRDQWRDVFNMALTSSGCAFEHRAMMSADPAIGAAYLEYVDEVESCADQYARTIGGAYNG